MKTIYMLVKSFHLSEELFQNTHQAGG